MDPIIEQLAKELDKQPQHVENVVRLLDEGNTIPFIARYRKELHGAMVLPDGRVVTGKTSDTLGAASALLLNALKAVGGIDDQFELISAQVLEPVCNLKTRYLGHRNPRLHTDEVLMALTISALTNPLAELAQQQLPKLRGCDAHFTVVLSDVDEKLLKRLGINVSCEAKYETKKLYHK